MKTEKKLENFCPYIVILTNNTIQILTNNGQGQKMRRSLHFYLEESVTPFFFQVDSCPNRQLNCVRSETYFLIYKFLAIEGNCNGEFIFLFFIYTDLLRSPTFQFFKYLSNQKVCNCYSFKSLQVLKSAHLFPLFRSFFSVWLPNVVQNLQSVS